MRSSLLLLAKNCSHICSRCGSGVSHYQDSCEAPRLLVSDSDDQHPDCLSTQVLTHRVIFQIWSSFNLEERGPYVKEEWVGDILWRNV